MFFIPLRAWWAFYVRWPDFVLDSREPAIQALVIQFKTEDEVSTAIRAFDCALSDNGLTTKNPTS